LIIEQIEDSRPREGLPQRIEVVSEHSAIALANVREHNELFLMPVWRAIGKARWVTEARQLPWTITIGVATLAVLLILFLWPANFELTAKGKLQPAVRREVFANMDGEVTQVLVKHGDMVKKGQVLAEMRNTELQVKVTQTQGQLQSVTEQLLSANARLNDRTLDKNEKGRLRSEVAKLQEEQTSAEMQLSLLESK
jgi:multidrug efflux pump subunit AcrA (membrane-fusion protein)